MFFVLPAAVPPAAGRAPKVREPPGQCITLGIPPELSNLINQVLALERIGPLRRGISPAATNLRSWIAADATHLHHDLF